jgi:hypothetical protein
MTKNASIITYKMLIVIAATPVKSHCGYAYTIDIFTYIIYNYSQFNILNAP